MVGDKNSNSNTITVGEACFYQCALSSFAALRDFTAEIVVAIMHAISNFMYYIDYYCQYICQ